MNRPARTTGPARPPGSARSPGCTGPADADDGAAGTGLSGRLRAAARERAAAGLDRRLRPRTAAGDGLLDLASNDYLGLARDRRVTAAAARAARTWGAGATGSRLVTGSTALHATLERELADFAGWPAALVFSSGYLANLAAVGVLAGPDTLVVSDAANHASLIDACRLARAEVAVAAHRDVADVERLLAGRRQPYALVVTDAVFSATGDLAPLPALRTACRRHSAGLLVDEAHALGVVGPGGRGAAAAAGLVGDPEVVATATLSKALGAQGGAVLAGPEVVAALVDAGRQFIFDTALAPPAAGAALAALRVLRSEPGLPRLVRERTADLAGALRTAGLPGPAPAAAVAAGLVGDPGRAVALRDALAAHGIAVGCFRPPSVPPGRSCLRITARANLTAAEVTRFAGALAAVT